MKTYRLEKAPYLNDGTTGEWETSCVGGKPELWHDFQKAAESVEKRTLQELDGCAWRIEGEDGW